MRKHLLRIIVTVMTLTLGLLLAGLRNQLLRPRPPLPATPCPTLTATPSQPPPASVLLEADEDTAEFPDSTKLTPWEIASFIDDHPRANLERLWKRLHVKLDQNHNWNLKECSHCTTSSNDFDLDGEPGNETLLKISDGLSEAYRYLVFKYHEDDRWTLLGYADAWGKYQESEAMIVVSDDKTWLLIKGQSASGSGVAFYHNDMFEVTRNKLNLILSYESEGYQNGYGSYPTEAFSTRVLSCRSYGNKAEVRIEYQTRYSFWSSNKKYEPLFSTRRVATFIKQSGHEAYVDESSKVTQRELDVYHVDSMTEADFLKYNHSELLNLATRGNAAQKKWLRTYLKECDNSSEKRQLLAALAN